MKTTSYLVILLTAMPWVLQAAHKIPSTISGHRVPVLMYHIIDPDMNILKNFTGYTLNVHPKDFKKHLHLMREYKFQPICLSELIRHDFSRVRPGWKPYVITFDDGWPGQFQIEKNMHNGEVVPTKDCAVGILEEFRKIEPTTTATFYISFVRDPEVYRQEAPFGAQKEVQAKMNFLKKHHYLVAAHSWSHYDFSVTKAEKAIKDIERGIEELEKYLGKGYIRHFAWPYGNETEDKTVRAYVEKRFDSIAYTEIDTIIATLPIAAKRLARVGIRNLNSLFNKEAFLKNPNMVTKIAHHRKKQVDDELPSASKQEAARNFFLQMAFDLNQIPVLGNILAYPPVVLAKMFKAFKSMIIQTEPSEA